MGSAAARSFPGQELSHHHLALGHHSRSAGAVPDRAGEPPRERSGTTALSLPCRGPGGGRLRYRPRGAFAHARSQGQRPSCAAVGNHNARHLYWTVAQLVAHHSSGGCNLRAGDLFGTGTISAPTEDGLGSLLELSAGGRRPVALASGETRRFLEDGDTVIMRARCRREGFAGIGFGECHGTIAPAL